MFDSKICFFFSNFVKIFILYAIFLLNNDNNNNNIYYIINGNHLNKQKKIFYFCEPKLNSLTTITTYIQIEKNYKHHSNLVKLIRHYPCMYWKYICLGIINLDILEYSKIAFSWMNFVLLTLIFMQIIDLLSKLRNIICA